MIAETDWLEGAECSVPRARGGRPLVHGRGRARKLECVSCGFICNASAGALERCGYPSCACGLELTLANFRDRLVLHEESALHELGAMRASTARELLRAEGLDPRDFARYLDGAVDRARERLSGAAQHRCAWEHGYCSRFVDGLYCNEHDPHELARLTREAKSFGGGS